MEATATGDRQLEWGSAAARWVLVATVLGSGMSFLDATVVNVALPTLGRELGATVAGLQWVQTGYLLSLAALILVGGALGDRYGRRRVFVIGVVGFAVASLLCGLAPSIPTLIVARVLQGIAGALLTPGSLAILQASFRPADRGRAIGAWSGLGGLAGAAGPLLGGVLVQAGSWRLVFLINLPLAVVVIALARHIPESRDPDATGRPDLAGAALGALGLGGVTAALVEGPEQGWGSALVVVAAVVGVAALVGFVASQARGSHPMLPLGIFRSRQLVAANLVTFAVYAALSGMLFLLVVELQNGLGLSPTAAGLATLPMTLLLLTLSAPSGALAQRIGPKAQLVAGPLLVAAGLLLFLRLEPGVPYWTHVLPGLVVFGLGMVTLVAPVTATALAAADERHAGVASGLNNAVARAAGLLAVAVLPVVAGLSGEAWTDPELLTAAFRRAMLAAAAVAASGALAALVGISNSVLRDAEDTDTAPMATCSHCPVDAPPSQVARREPAPARSR